MKLPRTTLVGTRDNNAKQEMYGMRGNLRGTKWVRTSVTEAKDQTLAERETTAALRKRGCF